MHTTRQCRLSEIEKIDSYLIYERTKYNEFIRTCKKGRPPFGR